MPIRQGLTATAIATILGSTLPASAQVFNPDSCSTSSVQSSYTPISISGTLSMTSCFQGNDASRNGKVVSVRLHYNQGATGQRGVVIFSHGGGERPVCDFPENGGWPAALARAGFVVVEVAHSETNAERNHACAQLGYSGFCFAGNQPALWNRPKDITYIIDNLAGIGNNLTDSSGAAMINRMDINRVGVAGHSNGAYTIMAVAGAQPKMGPNDTNQNFKYVGTAERPAPLAYLAASMQGNDDHGFYDNGGTDHSWQYVVSPSDEERPIMHITGYDDCTLVLPGACHDTTAPLNPESALNRATAFENMSGVSGVDHKMLVWVDVNDAEHSDFNLKTDNGTYDTQINDVIRSAGVAWFDAMVNANADAFTYLQSDNLKALMPAAAQLPGDASAIDICRANLTP